MKKAKKIKKVKALSIKSREWSDKVVSMEKQLEPYFARLGGIRNDAPEEIKELFEEYKKLAEQEKNVIFGGRLGNYKYYDMDAVIDSALNMCEKELV